MAGSGQAAFAAGGAAPPSSSSTRTVPVQACPAEPLAPGAPSPSPSLKPVAGSVPVPNGVTLPPSVTVYGASYPGDAQYLVAPSGWACDVVSFSADGGEQAYVHPGANSTDPLSAQYTSLVHAVFNSGGAQTNIDLACPFIPQATTPGGGAPPNTCTAQPHQSGDVLHVVPTNTPGLYVTVVGVPVGVHEPNLAASQQAPTSGQPNPIVSLVTFQGPGGPAQEISCALPKPGQSPSASPSASTTTPSPLTSPTSSASSTSPSSPVTSPSSLTPPSTASESPLTSLSPAAAASPSPTSAQNCQATLGYFLATGSLGSQLSSTNLSAALADLNGFIASFLGG
ncbi:hypothetical protein [Kitasatospora sp. LaBMicrA B282]|uniref:hypothetical protein n=1 Tax=Kitasatospora sp. LaBMicrA B282 TaxID=3420949 RepID=UPI003D102115